MGDRGILSGMYWHTEFQSKRKKDKAADCFYLDNDRNCNNKKSYYYLSKCFAASHCPCRVKEADAEKVVKQSNEIREAVSFCSLPQNCEVRNKAGDIGRLLLYDSSSGDITIQYGVKTVKYQYPEAFDKGFLFVSDELKKYVKMDIRVQSEGNIR